jgi:hypothetical protein
VLSSNKGLQEIITLQSSLIAKAKEQQLLNEKNNQYTATTNRVMKYLENSEASSAAQKNIWREELADASRNLSGNEKRAVALSDEISGLTDKLTACLKTLDLSWKVE